MNSTIISTTVAAMMALFGMKAQVAPVKMPVAMSWTQQAPQLDDAVVRGK